jgi:hypothetical protein
VTTIARALAIAAIGAVAGAAGVVFAFVFRPAIAIEMDRELPRNVSGVYAPEFIPGGESFAWTGRRASVALPGLDRRVAWSCTVRFRGGRASASDQPVVDFAVDGLSRGSRLATNTFEELAAEIPVTPGRAGAVITVTSSTTFVPGPGDARELGVQLDRLACRPSQGVALPPRRADITGLIGGALFGAAYGAIGVTPGSAAGAVVLLSAAQGFPLADAFGPYSAYLDRVPWLALWIALSMVAAVKGLEWPRRPALRQTARFAIAFAATALYLKLLGLLHPSKALVDAVFQAHRLEAVLGGSYYFTQLMPSGVRFPYAIGLYVFAAPWAAIARDHVTLLRIVVCAAGAVAAGTLYPMIARTWGDRLAGAIAVALFVVVPIDFWTVGNANLTNAFSQAIATIAVATVVIMARGRMTGMVVAAWTLLISLALLSHVSTFAILLVTLGALALLWWMFGGPELRRPAYALMLTTAIAVLFSVVTYWGHFGDVYKNALRVRSAQASAAAPVPAAPEQRNERGTGSGARTIATLGMVRLSLGWPILLLAAGGTWSVSRRGWRDPLVPTLAAWGVAFVLFLGVGLMRVEAQFERYSLEFVTRVAYAASPAAAVLAAAGAAWAWRAGLALRILAIAVLLWAVAVGLEQWTAWR